MLLQFQLNKFTQPMCSMPPIYRIQKEPFNLILGVIHKLRTPGNGSQLATFLNINLTYMDHQ